MAVEKEYSFEGRRQLIVYRASFELDAVQSSGR